MSQSERIKQIANLAIRSLMLSLSGWMLYGMVIATSRLIVLGLPWYDWQWYLAVILCLLFITIIVIWQLPKNIVIGSLFALTLWLVSGYNGFGQSIALDATRAEKVPISFWSNSDIALASDDVLTDIQMAGGYLYINVDRESFTGEQRQELIDRLKRLADRDINVYLNIFVSDYLSVPVADEWMAGVRKATELVRYEELENVRGMMGDAEAPYQQLKDYWGTDWQAFDSTVTRLEQFLSENSNLPVGVTASGVQFLDGLDGDSDLSRILRSPVDPPGGWAFINMMTYSSYLPESWQPYFMYVSEYVLPRLYPDQSLSYLIGLVGSPSEPEHTFDELVRDAQISRAMGVNEIVIFRLDGALKQYGDGFVQQLTAQVNNSDTISPLIIPFSRPVSLMMYGFLLGDALLDVRSWGGMLLGLFWIFVSFRLVIKHDSTRPSRRTGETF